MIEIKNIFFKDANDGKGMSLKTANLIKEFGIQGDLHGGKKGRNISIVDVSTIEKIKNLPVKGLCTERFKGNLEIKSDDIIEVNDYIEFGNAVIKITSKGKKCFMDCDIYRNKIICPMRDVYFADVVQSGEITQGSKGIVKK